VNFQEMLDNDLRRLFCDTRNSWGAEALLIGYDGQTFAAVVSLGENQKQAKEVGFAIGEGREVECVVCGLRNGDPRQDLVSAAWGRDLSKDDRIEIQAGHPDAGVWAVVWTQPTGGGNYRALVRLEQISGTTMRGQ